MTTTRRGDHLSGAVGIVPVAAHHRARPATHPADDSCRHDLAVVAYHLHLDPVTRHPTVWATSSSLSSSAVPVVSDASVLV